MISDLNNDVKENEIQNTVFLLNGGKIGLWTKNFPPEQFFSMISINFAIETTNMIVFSFCQHKLKN